MAEVCLDIVLAITASLQSNAVSCGSGRRAGKQEDVLVCCVAFHGEVRGCAMSVRVLFLVDKN